MPKLFKLLTTVFALFLCISLSAQNSSLTADVDPDGGTFPHLGDAPGDSLAYYDIEAITGETGNLGTTYAFGFLWVTCRGLVNPNGNSLYKIDISTGTPVYVADYPQGNTDAWGWRDLATDGTFLYASVTSNVEQIDPATGLPTGVTIPGPITPNRALAYDPATDHFWTASFSSDLYEFDRAGNVINQFPSAASMYGAGWDAYSPSNPWLWINGGTGAQLIQVDPLTGLPTGVVYTVSGGSDGGMSINADLFPGLVVAVALVQETPDGVYVYEIDVPIPVELTSFTADVNDNNVTLNWSTATETNNQGFEIERSSGGDFVNVGYVEGNGTVADAQNYVFVDNNVEVGSYSYRLKQIDFDGSYEYSEVINVDLFPPDEFVLAQNYPNPFNPSTTIKFSLAVDSKVTLTVFDMLGQEVAQLIDGNFSAGVQEYNFNASGLNSGVYFYRIDAKGINGTDFSSVKKMILTK